MVNWSFNFWQDQPTYRKTVPPRSSCYILVSIREAAWSDPFLKNKLRLQRQELPLNLLKSLNKN